MTPRQLISITALAVALTAGAQSSSDDFNSFRQSLMKDYSEFRQGVLDDYASFLDGVWEEYRRFQAVERDSVPKPKVAPVAPEQKPKRLPWTIKTPVEQPAPTPATPSVPKPKPAPRPAPSVKPATRPSDRPVAPTGKEVDFYGVGVVLPQVKADISADLSATSGYASAWRAMEQSDLKSTLLPAISAKAYEMGLNDYLTSELVGAAVGSIPGLGPGNARQAAKHYLLANMGYDVRLGLNSAKKAVLLVPFEQESVFGRAYLNIGGKRYYMFFADDTPAEAAAAMAVYTCRLPSDADLGRKMNLRVNPLNLPYKPQPYRLAAAGLEVSGEFNANILKMLYRYPQMAMGEYAMSAVLPDVRASIVGQLREQLSGRPEREAVDTLLQFVQKAFDYATDPEFHGFEKPNFFEETLAFSKCDCEDRAIFYTYLLKNVLGLGSQLLYFPGHESVGVALSEQIKGDSYTHDGVTYYISDPTYIGSVTGMCMPDFRQSQPRIDFTYPR